MPQIVSLTPPFGLSELLDASCLYDLMFNALKVIWLCDAVPAMCL